MPNDTSIEWTGRSSNPIRAINLDNGKNGTFCVHVSPGCKGCYAGTMNCWRGNGLAYTAPNRNRVRFELNEDELARWVRSRKREMIFVCSMTDLFFEDIPEEMVLSVFGAMALTPHKTFQVLTKRPARMRELLCRPDTQAEVAGAAEAIALDLGWCHADWAAAMWPLPNVWLGTSVEDQQRAGQRIPHLLRCPAAVRWLSVEPLLDAVDLEPWLWSECPHQNVIQGYGCADCQSGPGLPSRALDWVVVGGESGLAARPMHPSWARQLRDQCQTALVPFFFKQWGEWASWDPSTPRPRLPILAVYEDGQVSANLADALNPRDPAVAMARYGKRQAGRTLDGRTWDEYPEVARV